MCFPKPKVVVAPPQESESANQAAAQARVNAEEAKRKEEEEYKLLNLPENLEGSTLFTSIEDAISWLEDARDSLNEVGV